MVLGIHIAMLSLWLVMMSVAMMILPSKPLVSLAGAAIPTLWLVGILRAEWQDVMSGRFVEMMKNGIVDPAKVVRSALQNAASVASLMLTTEAMVVDKPEEDKNGAATPPMPPM